MILQILASLGSVVPPDVSQRKTAVRGRTIGKVDPQVLLLFEAIDGEIGYRQRKVGERMEAEDKVRAAPDDSSARASVGQLTAEIRAVKSKIAALNAVAGQAVVDKFFPSLQAEEQGMIVAALDGSAIFVPSLDGMRVEQLNYLVARELPPAKESGDTPVSGSVQRASSVNGSHDRSRRGGPVIK